MDVSLQTWIGVIAIVWFIIKVFGGIEVGASSETAERPTEDFNRSFAVASLSGDMFMGIAAGGSAAGAFAGEMMSGSDPY